MRMRKKPNLIPRMEACSDIWIREPESRRGRWKELYPEAMVMAMEKVKAAGLTNVFFIGEDVAKAAEFFAPGEIDLLYINFCDPWPHKKHAPRRLTHAGFLKLYQQIMRPGSEIHFKTDNAGLFEFSLEQFAACGFPLRNVTRDLHKNGPVGIMTGYEEKFYQLGTPICRLEAICPEIQEVSP